MNSLAQTVITIAINYLGPAGERFIMRQVTAHLQGGVTLETLQPEHLPELARWVEVSSALLLDDKSKAHEFAEQIRTAAG